MAILNNYNNLDELSLDEVTLSGSDPLPIYSYHNVRKLSLTNFRNVNQSPIDPQIYQMLSRFRGVTSLTIKSNLKIIQESTLWECCSGARELDFSDNNFYKLFPNTFIYVPYVTKLVITSSTFSSPLDEIAANIFRANPRLQYLEISNHKNLTAIPVLDNLLELKVFIFSGEIIIIIL